MHGTVNYSMRAARQPNTRSCETRPARAVKLNKLEATLNNLYQLHPQL